MRLLLLLALAGCTSSNAVPPMVQPDLAEAADLGPADPPDLLVPPSPAPEAIWIGSGGSGKSATQQLNFQIGGSGTSTAPSGARLHNGYFAIQAY